MLHAAARFGRRSGRVLDFIVVCAALGFAIKDIFIPRLRKDSCLGSSWRHLLFVQLGLEILNLLLLECLEVSFLGPSRRAAVSHDTIRSRCHTSRALWCSSIASYSFPSTLFACYSRLLSLMLPCHSQWRNLDASVVIVGGVQGKLRYVRKANGFRQERRSA